ncbi:MAG: multidrug ABC transporter ATP-binding protein, partial [Gammaproteobacteria bacterium]|nr:multidrug ABC transporter ATP-binding protein [Gammaproteobacteria bacterium]
IPQSLANYKLILSDDGNKLTYTYDTMNDSTGITSLLQAIHASDLTLKDLEIKKSSLEDVFVDLLKVEKMQESA